MAGALWKGLQETQQLITDVLPYLDQEEREINITRY